MTIVSKLIKDCKLDKQPSNIIIDSIYYDILCRHYSKHLIFNMNQIYPFGTYDVLIIDQDKISRIEFIYKKFMPQVLVIDTMTSFIEEENASDYNIDLINVYSVYRQRYNCIFIALNNEDYKKSNLAHDLVYDINNKKIWTTLVWDTT